MIKQPPLISAIVDELKMTSITWKQWFTEFFTDYQTLNTTVSALGYQSQTITAASAVTLSVNYVDISKSGAGTYAITLAAPTQNNIVKTIQMTAVSGGGTVTLALTNCIGGTASTTATFDAVNESLVLISVTNKWLIIKQHGVTLT
jgi:hypothetical protein